jgi:hypothetical protein
MLLGTLLLPWRVQAGNIFDDNWTPPKPAKPVEPPADASATKPAKAPEPGKADTPVKTPTTLATTPSPTLAPPARRAIPAPVDQAKSRKLFKEVFATELADRSPAARRALATKLLEQAAGVGDAPADQFVLLVGATEAGKEASDLGLCCRAADALAGAYEVDGLRIKSEAAAKMTLRADSPAAATENCREGLTLIDQLVAADDYVTAGRLLSGLRAAAAQDGALSSQIQNRAKEFDALRTAAERVAPYLQKLKTAPEDAAANLAAGQYFCFIKDDWKHGLPLLAKCGRAELSAAAALDLAGANDPDTQIAVGDAWWASAEKEAGSTQLAIRRRAANWYSMALQSGTIAGLKRALLEKRIATAPSRIDGASVPAAFGGAAHVTIIRADYGNGDRTVSIAKAVQAALDADPFAPIDAGNSWGGDPCGGAHKTLALSYRIGETTSTVEVSENEICFVPPIAKEGVALAGASVRFKIIAARYGADNRWVDATEAIRAEVTDPSEPVIVRNMAGGKDLLNGKVKKLVIYFEIGGRRYVQITPEKSAMTLVPK